jgi:undecaprenyl-diphosphatase
MAAILNLLNQCAVVFDLPVLEWIRANLQSGFLDIVMPIITVFGDGGIFWIAWAVLLLCFPKTRRTGLGMGIALMLGVVICNIILKPGVARPRPYDMQEELGVIIPLLVDRMHDFSFPSGHTIASFEAAVVLLMADKRMGIPAIILACLVAFSRLYLYVHYPTDVLVSVVLGTLFAVIGYFLAKVIPLPEGKKGKYQA